MIREEPERNLQYVAEPIGVVMAILPVTNPTSTALFKAIVAAKTRNAMVFRPSPRAIQCALRTVEILRKAGVEAGMPEDTPPEWQAAEYAKARLDLQLEVLNGVTLNDIRRRYNQETVDGDDEPIFSRRDANV